MSATALISASLISSSALAAVTNIGTATAVGANSTTLLAMQAQCAAIATGLGTDYSGALDPLSITNSPVGGPTEAGTEGNRTLTSDKTPGLTATYTPAHKEIAGDPYRNGGSVNMFGVQQSVGGAYSTSQYDFTASFNSTFAYGFNCTITQTIHHHDLVTPAVPPTPGTGHHYRMDGNTHAQNCVQMDIRGDHFGETGPGPGPDDPDYDPNDKSEGGTCLWAWDTPPTPGSPAVYHDYDTTVVTNPAGVPVNQDQSETLSAHETDGAGYSDSATVTLGQVVVCISPTKLPGTWKAQNGYTGIKCTTAWYSGKTPYDLTNYAGTNVPNLNDGSHNMVTVPVN